MSKESSACKLTDIHVRPLIHQTMTYHFMHSYFDAYIKQNTKLTASVKSSILKLLGKISRYYPDSIDDKQALSLELRLMQAIQSLFDAKADLPHIEGGVQGLNDYLFRNDIRLDLNKVFHAVSFMIEGLVSSYVSQLPANLQYRH